MEFRILGPLEVVDEGRALPLGRRQQRAVLAVLLVHADRVVATDRLVDEVWGARPPPDATASLHTAVSRLRRLLEPGRPPRSPARVLVSRPPGYRLAVAAEDLDALRFQALAAQGHQLLEAGRHEAAAAVLAEGLALWRGPVLADFPDAPFAEGERGWLEELRLTAAEDRADAELALGRHVAVVPDLEQLVAAHPFRERLRGLHVLALYRCGRQVEALQAHRSACRALREELGLDPSPWLRDLEQLVLRQSPDLDRLSAAPPPPAPSGPEPLAPAVAAGMVGRDRQLAVLTAALRGAAARHGRVVLVSGEPGIGKTRLVEELSRCSSDAGVRVAWGRCEEGPGAPAFWPWAQVLRDLLTGVPADRVGAVLGPAGPELVPVLPELTELLGPAPVAPVADVDAVRFRMCQAVAAALHRLSATRPMLVVLDDLHWADAGSLRLLPVLADRVRGAPLLVVGTHRDVDLPDDAPLADALAALARRPSVDRVVLEGIGPDEVAELVAAELGPASDERLVHALHDRTGGNPFFVVELLRELAREGRPSGAGSAVALAVPSGVRDVLRRRLAALPQPTRTLLRTAAVVGRGFDLDVVRTVAGLDDDTAVTAVEEGLRSGLVVEDPDAVDRFRFVHSLVRDAIDDDTSRARLARLHARVAQALLERPGPDGAEHALRLAHHWWLAAPAVGADAVLPHLLTAADVALGRLAHEEAEQQLHRALVLLGSMPRSPGRIRAELGVQMRRGALAAQLHGTESPATRAAAARAAELAEELADPAATIAAWRNLYEVALVRAEHDQARELAERMLRVAERSGDPAASAAASLALGRTLWCQGDPATARTHLEHGLVLAERAPAGPHEPLPVAVTLRLQLAPVLDLLGLHSRAADLVDAAVAGTRDVPPLVRAGVLTSAVLVSALRRDVPAAGRFAAETLSVAAELPAWLSYATAVQAWTQVLAGDEADALHRLRDTVDEIASRGAQHLLPSLQGLLAEAEQLAGRPGEALRLLDDALAGVVRTGERAYEAELHRLRGAALLAGTPPRPAEAAMAFRTAVEVARRQGADLLRRRAAEELRRPDLARSPGHRGTEA